MKKYFFALFLFIIALISINSVFAATPNGWGFDVQRSTMGNVYDCSSSDCNVNLNARVENVNSSVFYYYSYDSTSMTANGPGSMWVYLLESPMSKDYLYSITSYVCQNTTNVNLLLKDYYSSNSIANVYGKVDKGTSYFSQSLSNLSYIPYTTSDDNFMKCSYFTSIYKPSVNSKYVGVNFTTDLNANNFMTSFIGYKVESLGLANNLSSSDIQNIIGSSGLASASDINSLNSSITNIQNQLSNNISQAETSINNNIDSAESNVIDNVNRGINSVNDNLRSESENIQNGIKQGFESCRDSYNLLDNSKVVKGRLDNGVLGYSNGTSSLSYTADSISFSTNASYRGITTDFIPISSSNYLFFTWESSSISTYITCSYFDSSKNFITIREGSSITNGKRFDTNISNASFVRFTIQLSTASSVDISKPMVFLGSSSISYEKYGEQVCTNRLDSTNDKLDDLNGTLNNSDSSGATDDAGSFFSGFSTNTFGLTSIITAPLNLINSLTSKTCTPLRLQIPFVNQNLDLPCMTTIYQTHFGTFLTIYQTITFGITSYWICIRIFALVKDFKNPDHDEIEVMDL